MYASAELQFGHGGDAVDDASGGRSNCTGVDGFNSATAVTPWMTAVAAHLRRLHDLRFNSATAVTPWMTRVRTGRVAR